MTEDEITDRLHSLLKLMQGQDLNRYFKSKRFIEKQIAFLSDTVWRPDKYKDKWLRTKKSD